MSPTDNFHFQAEQLRGVHQPALRHGGGLLREAGETPGEGGAGHGGRVGRHILPDD